MAHYFDYGKLICGASYDVILHTGNKQYISAFSWQLKCLMDR